MRLISRFSLFAVLALLGCNTPPQVPSETGTMGLLKVTISGIGEGTTATATAEWVKAGVSRQSATVVPVNGTGNLDDVQFSRGAVNFSDDDRNSTRYVYTTFDLTNRTTTNFNNFTLYALNAPSNIGGTGIASMTAATGAAITSESVARGFQPAHTIRPTQSSVKVNEDLADFQMFTPAETADIKTQAVAQGIVTSAATVLEYGFVARNYTNNIGPSKRFIASRDSASLPACNSNSCKATITLSYKFPKVSPRQNNPFAFTLYFVAANETRSYISESLEDRTTNTVAGLSDTSSFAQTRLLAGSTFGVTNNGINNLCQVKTAIATTTNPSNILLPSSLPPAPSGSPDGCFASGGRHVSVSGFGSEQATAIALQPDGKIIAAGTTVFGSSYFEEAIVGDVNLERYNPNGLLDAGFGFNGKVVTNFSQGPVTVTAVALQSDGKIVVAGGIGSIGSDFFLARYTPNGDLDTTFDGDGLVQTPIASSYEAIGAIAIQSDGKILAVGNILTGNNDIDFALARYNPSGSLDTSFDGDGKVITPILSGYDFPKAVALQPDGKIVVGGYAQNGPGNDFVLVRYNPNGSLDSSFDFDGLVFTSLGAGNDEINALAIQPDGKIIAAGSSNITPLSSPTLAFALARYNPDGSLDASFDGDAEVITQLGARIDVIQAMKLQSDGKIVVTGYSYNESNRTDIVLARYNPNGSLDTGFDGDGKKTDLFISGYNAIKAMAIQPNGKIVLAGYILDTTSQRSDFALARYNP